MKKRNLCLVLVVLMFVSLFPVCEAANDDKSVEIPECTIYYLNNNTSDAMNGFVDDVVAEFNKIYPQITVEVQSGGSDYYAVLATKINSGEMPDIFHTGGGTDMEVYKNYSYDLRDDPELYEWFTNEFSAAAQQAVTTADGKVTGFAPAAAVTGWVYNKDLFEKAGITEKPATLEEFEAACEKLVAIGVTPFSMPYKEWWILRHEVTAYIGESFDCDYSRMVEELNNGTTKFADLSKINDMFDMLDLTIKYGIDKQLEYDVGTGSTFIGTGEAAIQQQGTWQYSAYMDIDPDLNLGMLGWPIGNDASRAKVNASFSGTVNISSSTANFDAVKAFLMFYFDKMAHTAEGVAIWSPNAMTTVDNSLISNALELDAMELESREGPEDYMPFEFQQDLGTILQEYVAGTLTREQTIEQLQKSWDKNAS